MKQVHQERHKLEDGRLIEITIYYKPGTGYTLNAIPVVIRETTGSSGAIIETKEFVPSEGFNQILLRAERPGTKRLEGVIKMLEEKRNFYLNYFKR